MTPEEAGKKAKYNLNWRKAAMPVRRLFCVLLQMNLDLMKRLRSKFRFRLAAEWGVCVKSAAV